MSFQLCSNSETMLYEPIIFNKSFSSSNLSSFIPYEENLVGNGKDDKRSNKSTASEKSFEDGVENPESISSISSCSGEDSRKCSLQDELENECGLLMKEKDTREKLEANSASSVSNENFTRKKYNLSNLVHLLTTTDASYKSNYFENTNQSFSPNHSINLENIKNDAKIPESFDNVKVENEETNGGCLVADEKISSIPITFQETKTSIAIITPSVPLLSSSTNSSLAKNKCDLCGIYTSTSMDMSAHMLSAHFHYQCKVCDFNARTEGRLKRHMLEFHDDPNSITNPKEEADDIRNPKLLICESDFSPPLSSKRHSESGNNSSSNNNNTSSKMKSFRCKHCTFVSSNKSLYWTHYKSHLKPEKALTCPKCCFVTEYKHHLEYHLRNHLGSKPYRCSKCNYACVNKSMLNSHMKSHSSHYQYRCFDCSYATKYCHSLKMHLLKYNHAPSNLYQEAGEDFSSESPDQHSFFSEQSLAEICNDKKSFPNLEAPSMTKGEEESASFGQNIHEYDLPCDCENKFSREEDISMNSTCNHFNKVDDREQETSFNRNNSSFLPMDLSANKEEESSIRKSESKHRRKGKAVKLANLDFYDKTSEEFAFAHASNALDPVAFSSVASSTQFSPSILSAKLKSPNYSFPSHFSPNIFSPSGFSSSNNNNFDTNFLNYLNVILKLQTQYPEYKYEGGLNNVFAPLQTHLTNPSLNFTSAFFNPRDSLAMKSNDLLFQKSVKKQQFEQEAFASTASYNSLDLSANKHSFQHPRELLLSSSNSTSVKEEFDHKFAYEDDSDQRRDNGSNEHYSDGMNKKKKREDSSSNKAKHDSSILTSKQHAGRGKLYECSFCCIYFEDMILYTLHMGYHSCLNPFTCNMCGKQTFDKTSFFMHLVRDPHH